MVQIKGFCVNINGTILSGIYLENLLY